MRVYPIQPEQVLNARSRLSHRHDRRRRIRRLVHHRVYLTMNFTQAIDPVRPILQLIGTVCLIAGLLKFFGVNIPIGYPGLELAVAGYLLKSV